MPFAKCHVCPWEKDNFGNQSRSYSRTVDLYDYHTVIQIHDIREQVYGLLAQGLFIFIKFC